MLPLKIIKEKQDDLITNATAETDLERWKTEQLEIFSDIIIAILLKDNFKPDSYEK